MCCISCALGIAWCAAAKLRSEEKDGDNLSAAAKTSLQSMVQMNLQLLSFALKSGNMEVGPATSSSCLRTELVGQVLQQVLQTGLDALSSLPSLALVPSPQAPGQKSPLRVPSFAPTHVSLLLPQTTVCSWSHCLATCAN